MQKTRNTAATLSENESVSTHVQEIEKFLTERWIETRAEDAWRLGNEFAPLLEVVGYVCITALVAQESRPVRVHRCGMAT